MTQAYNTDKSILSHACNYLLSLNDKLRYLLSSIDYREYSQLYSSSKGGINRFTHG